MTGPRRSAPWDRARWAVVDVETTGLAPERDELLSFAVVPIDDGRIQVGRSIYRLVRPRRMPDERTVVIHGIRPADVARAPALEDVLPELVDALAGRAMVAHVAPVERAFLEPPLRARGHGLPKPVADTDALGRAWMAGRGLPVGEPPLELGDLAAALGLPVHRPHHALGDALTTAQAFLALATHLSARRTQTVASLARAEPRLLRSRRYDWSGRP